QLDSQLARCGCSLAAQYSTMPGWNLVNWQTEIADTDNLWSSGNAITIPPGRGGVWAVTFWTFLPGASQQFDVRLDMGGETYNGATSVAEIPSVRPLSGGDTVAAAVFVQPGPIAMTARIHAYRVSP